MILTITEPRDDHTFFVQEALRAKGSDTTLWFISDLAQHQAVSVDIDGAQTRTRIEGLDISLPEVDPSVIWLRRPSRPVLAEDNLHPADRKWARDQYEEFYWWLLRDLPKDAFWVNSFDSSRSGRSKIAQQRAAHRAGLSQPRTLYSNDPDAIRTFVRANGGQVVYKAFSQAGPWKLANDGYALLFTARLTEDTLPDDEVLRATPGIFQPLVPKAYELRVTVIGRHVFAAKVDSQAMSQGRLDWRRGLHEMPDNFQAIELPENVTAAIYRLMDDMGLIFGCLDFIVTPDDEHVFLEINEMGQFLFIEDYTGLPVLDAFCELLIQARPDFDWSPERVEVRVSDFEQVVSQRRTEAETQHVLPPEHLAGVEMDETRTESAGGAAR